MTNVVKKKSEKCIEWTVKTPDAPDSLVSETFSFLYRDCNLKLTLGRYDYGCSKYDESYLIFTYEGELKAPINLSARVAAPSGIQTQTIKSLTTTNTSIWSSSNGGLLRNILLTFEVVIYADPSTDDKSVQTPLYIDTSFLLEGVSKDLSSLFDESPNHDVEFICGDQAIKAHKTVLCCRSEVFATMLRTEMAEGKTGQVKIQDIQCTLFKQFLRYLYTGVLPELTVDTALQIYEVADKYAVSALKKQCASFLVEHLSPENACEILIISDRHSDSDFKKNVMEYVIEEKIPFEKEILSKFCKDNSTLAAEVLNLFCLYLREKKFFS